MTEYVVEVSQLTRRFGATLALDVVNLKAERGMRAQVALIAAVAPLKPSRHPISTV